MSKAASILAFALFAAPLATAFAAAPGKTESARYQENLDAGLAAFVEGEYAKAAQSFRRALEARPGDSQAAKALRSAQKRMARMDTEENALDRQELNKAKRYFKDQHYLISIMALKSVLRRNPDNLEAEEFLPKVSKKIDSLIAAEAQNSYRWLVYKGMQSYLVDQYGSGIAFWKKALEQNPDDHLLALAIEEAQTHPTPAGALVQNSLLPAEPCDCDLPASSATVAAAAPAPKSVAAKIAAPKPELPAAPKPAAVAAVPEKPAPVSTPAVRTAEPPPPAPKSEEKPVPPPAKPAPAPALEAPIQKQVRAAPAAAEPAGLALVRSQLSRGNYKEALRTLERVRSENPGSEAAQNLYDRALRERDDACAKHYRQGLLEYANGDYARAIDEWKTVLRMNPEHDAAKKVLLRAFFRPRS